METVSQPELVSPVVSPLGQSAIINPREVKPTRERMQHVLDLLQPYAARGFEITADDVSVTIRKGKVAECLNITCTDKEFTRACNRVAVGAASRGADVTG